MLSLEDEGAIRKAWSRHEQTCGGDCGCGVCAYVPELLDECSRLVSVLNRLEQALEIEGRKADLWRNMMEH